MSNICWYTWQHLPQLLDAIVIPCWERAVQMAFKSWRQLFYNFLSSCEGCCRKPRTQLWHKPKKQNFVSSKEESNLKKRRGEGIAISPLRSWQAEVRVVFPEALPSAEPGLYRVHGDTSYRQFADLQNTYKGSYEDGTLRHDSPYTQHIHWKQMFNLQCNINVFKNSSGSSILTFTDNQAMEECFCCAQQPQPCTLTHGLSAKDHPEASLAPARGSWQTNWDGKWSVQGIRAPISWSVYSRSHRQRCCPSETGCLWCMDSSGLQHQLLQLQKVTPCTHPPKHPRCASYRATTTTSSLSRIGPHIYSPLGKSGTKKT